MDFRKLDMTGVEDMPTGNAKYQVIPQGSYEFKVVSLEEKATNKGDGMYIKGVFAIIKGQFAGAKVFHNFNYEHTKKQVADIGKAHLNSFCMACVGHKACEVGNSEDLIGQTFTAFVDIKEAQTGKDGKHYGESNVIKKWMTRDVALDMAKVAEERAKFDADKLPDSAVDSSDIPF